MKTFLLSFLLVIISVIAGWFWSYIFIQEVHNTTNSRWSISPLSVPQAPESMRDIENNIAWIAEALGPSVVSIIINRDIVIYRSDPWWFFQEPNTTVRRQVGGGSGFFIREDGLILTNKHVIQDTRSDYTVILSDGREFEVEVIATDPLNDIAIIKIDAPWERFPVPSIVEETSDVRIWSFSIAIWNALAEFQNSVSLGIVSGKNRSIEAEWTILSNLIQTDAAINPGNSWWPLLSLDGEVIGINTAIAWRTSGIWFAIALTTSRIEYLLESIERYGEIRRPFIGINYIVNSPWVARELWLPLEYGAYILDEPKSIVAWSSADKAGLKPWDIITHVNKIELTTMHTLASILQNSLPWDNLELRLLRNGETLNINLELGIY